MTRTAAAQRGRPACHHEEPRWTELGGRPWEAGNCPSLGTTVLLEEGIQELRPGGREEEPGEAKGSVGGRGKRMDRGLKTGESRHGIWNTGVWRGEPGLVDLGDGGVSRQNAGALGKSTKRGANPNHPAGLRLPQTPLTGGLQDCSVGSWPRRPVTLTSQCWAVTSQRLVPTSLLLPLWRSQSRQQDTHLHSLSSHALERLTDRSLGARAWASPRGLLGTQRTTPDLQHGQTPRCADHTHSGAALLWVSSSVQRG